MLNDAIVPPAIRRTFDRSLATFLRPGDPTPPDAQRGVRPAQRVFSLGLESISKNQPIHDSAAATSWRFLVGTRFGSGLYATVAHRDNEAPELTGMSRGPQAAVAIQANQDVRKLREAKEHDYDLCILAIPGLLTECFWLKWIPEDPKQDLIVPFVTPQKELMPMHTYTVDEFTKIAGLLAKKRLDAEQRLKEEAMGRAKERLAAANEKRAAWRRQVKLPADAEPPIEQQRERRQREPGS